MVDYSVSGAVTVGQHNDENIQQLCLQCRGITLESICVSGGYFHYGHFSEIVAQAKHCVMCELVRDGLRRNFADRQCGAEGLRALDEYLYNQEDAHFHDGPVMIKPWLVEASTSSERDLPVLKASIVSVSSCLFNWWPRSDMRYGAQSPLRPVGLPKLQLARRWFEHSLSCKSVLREPRPRQKKHRSKENSAIVHKPSRILDLGMSESQLPKYVRLVSSWPEHENGYKSPRYIALSHRWGPSHKLVTTTKNHLNHMLGIKFSDLPRTFQDAAIVALSLGVRYLWIDALSILQDDEIDWHREALVMGRIYAGAVCTIAVHNARDDSEGFLEQSLRPQPHAVLGHYHRGGEFYVSMRSNFTAEVDRSELSGRGWVLQERFLSARTLHFTQESIFFEDFSGIKAEEDTFSPALAAADNSKSVAEIFDPLRVATLKTTSLRIPKGPWMDLAKPLIGSNVWSGGLTSVVNDYWPSFQLPATPAFNLSYRLHGKGYKDLFQQWPGIVERYSRAKLTFATDKLPAISGLAKHIQYYTGKEYCSGIWPGQFHIHLLWSSDRTPIKRTTISRAPSWSWASIDGPVQYPQLPHEFRSRALLLNVNRWGDMSFNAPASLTLRARLASVSIASLGFEDDEDVAVGKSPFLGELNQPAIVRRVIGQHTPQDLIWFSQESIFSGGSYGPIGWAAIDEETSFGAVYCAGIAFRDSDRGDSDWALLLCPTGREQQEYRRVGIVLMDFGIRFFDRVEETDFTVV